MPQFSFGDMLEGLELYGENLFGVHSIEYDNIVSASLCPFFRLFGVKRCGVWISWPSLVELGETLNLQTVPVVLPPGPYTVEQVRRVIEERATERSALSRTVPPEGYVVRKSRSFHTDEFAHAIAKYVRKNHVQTGLGWKRKWRKARVVAEAET